MDEKILETATFCRLCECIIKDSDLAHMECSQCDPLCHWEDIEIVMRTKEALKNVNRACEKICKIDAELDEY